MSGADTFDVQVGWSAEFAAGDVALDGADLASETGLRSAVIMSLFTDREVGADELPEGESDRRGWWADALGGDDRIGSKLWLLRREKQTPDVLVRAERYASEALAWLVEDGHATKVTTGAIWTRPGQMEIAVTIERARGDVERLGLGVPVGAGA